MYLAGIIRKYLSHPYPVWQNKVTQLLVEHKSAQLQERESLNSEEYNTARCIDNVSNPQKTRMQVMYGAPIYLESSAASLNAFYEDHGLEVLTREELIISNSLLKLRSALELLKTVPPAYDCVVTLVRCIQILKAEDPEIDVSYSHPEIPFSIFVSLADDNSFTSNLRVAESILHETMHLNLTLIENVVDLVELKSGNLYFSPWREEKRPAQGVLHGLFVFRAILDFLGGLQEKDSDYIDHRKAMISEEILELEGFNSCADLTRDGAILTKNLLTSS